VKFALFAVNKNNGNRDRASRSLVKFYGSIACDHGVRLSALVAHVVGWLRDKRQTNPTAYEYDPCEKFGEAIGVGTRQVYRLLAQAKKLGFLDFKRSLRQMRVWVTKASLFDIPYEFYYDRDLADKFGLNASILYVKIYYHTANPEPGTPPGYRANLYRWVQKFPWMTETGVKTDLIRLRQRKLIDWDQENCHFTSNRYFTPKLFPAPAEENVVNTVRKSLGLKPDLVHPAPPVSQGQTGPGHKSGSPQSGGGSGKLYYNLDEE